MACFQVCGINMRNAQYNEAASVLRQCTGSINMLVQFNPQSMYVEQLSDPSLQIDVYLDYIHCGFFSHGSWLSFVCPFPESSERVTSSTESSVSSGPDTPEPHRRQPSDLVSIDTITPDTNPTMNSSHRWGCLP